MTQATTTALGEIKLAGDLAGNNNANAPALTATAVTAGLYSLPTITVDTKGRLTAASNTSGSTLAALLADATSSVKGIASFGTGLTVTSGNVVVDNATVISNIPIATGSVFGLVKSGTNITNTAGVLSVADATGSVSGVVKSGANITNTAGVLSIADATPSVKGVASFGTGFIVTAGSIALDSAAFPIATGSVFGLVKSGTNITNTAGVLSIADATSSVKGVASFGTDFTVTAGAVTVNYANLTPNLTAATSSIKGVASFSTDFTVTAGAVTVNYANLTSNLPVATSSVFGLVKSGTNITNTTGVLSIADATDSVKGVLTTADSSVLTFSSGILSLVATVARTTLQNTWSRAQSYAVSTLTYNATVAPDFSLSNVFTLTATGNFVLANPTNVVAGTTYLIFVKQDATGSRIISWGTNFKFGNTTVTSLTTTANKTDIISIVAQSTTELLVTLQKGF